MGSSVAKFLLKFSDALRAQIDENEAANLALKLLAEHLNLECCFIVALDIAEKKANTIHQFVKAGTQPVPSIIYLADFPTPLQQIFEQTSVCNNIYEDPNFTELDRKSLSALQYIAYIAAGIRHGEKKPIWAVAATSSRPRHWTAKEITLVEEVAERTWTALSRIRTENALKEADRRKDEFLAVLAHELRNPLLPIKNAIYLLQENNDKIDQQALVSIMERQVNHMVRLVDDLLEVTRIATGKIELRKENISIKDAINNAIEMSSPLIQSNNQRLLLDMPSQPIIVHADMVRLTQIFANLLNNAAKYTPTNGKITITVYKEDTQVVISIKDNGSGIATEILPHIFEIFSQGINTRITHNTGLGVGLSMARSLIELHAGTIKVYSAGENQGSEFIVKLPLIEEPLNLQNNKRVKTTSPLSKLRILMADDNTDIINSFAMLFDVWNVTAQFANCGENVLAVIDEFKPHVILLDIGMPGMDGYAVAEKIRQNPQYNDIQLIALTGWSQEKDRHKSRTSGFNQHLAKPVDINFLQNFLTHIAESTS